MSIVASLKLKSALNWNRKSERNAMLLIYGSVFSLIIYVLSLKRQCVLAKTLILLLMLNRSTFYVIYRHLSFSSVSYTHLRAHETGRNLVCRLLLEKKKI